MRRSRFTEAQIVAALRQAESGAPVAEALSQARGQRDDVLPLEAAVRRARGERAPRAAAAPGRESQLKLVVADLTLDKQILRESSIHGSRSGWPV
jgi:putative transposase